MKEELQSKLVEVLTSIQSVAGKAGDFAMEQLPDVAQSYIAYGRAFALAGVLGALLLLGVGLAVCWFGRREQKRHREQWEQKHPDANMGYFDRYDPFPYYMPGGMVLGVGTILAGFSVHEFMLVWFAPKVWLLKEIASLVK